MVIHFKQLLRQRVALYEYLSHVCCYFAKCSFHSQQEADNVPARSVDKGAASEGGFQYEVLSYCFFPFICYVYWQCTGPAES